MKEIKDKSLEFVLHHYQTGKFDTQKALRKVAPAKVIPLWRKVAVAASFTLLLLAGAYAAYTTGIFSQIEDPIKSEQPATTTTIVQTSKHFHFDNTPLESVLRDLSEYYSVQLYCNNTSKRLSGDFHADPSSTNLQEIIHVIEQTLDVTIQIK